MTSLARAAGRTGGIFLSHAEPALACAAEALVRKALPATRIFNSGRPATGVKPGAAIDNELTTTIKGSAVLLWLGTPRAAQAQWCSIEIGMAYGAGICVIPTRAYGLSVRDVPPVFPHRNVLDLATVDGLIETLRAVASAVKAPDHLIAEAVDDLGWQNPFAARRVRRAVRAREVAGGVQLENMTKDLMASTVIVDSHAAAGHPVGACGGGLVCDVAAARHVGEFWPGEPVWLRPTSSWPSAPRQIRVDWVTSSNGRAYDIIDVPRAGA